MKNFKTNQKANGLVIVAIAIIVAVVVIAVAYFAFGTPASNNGDPNDMIGGSIGKDTYTITGTITGIRQVTVGDSSDSNKRLTWIVGVDEGSGNIRKLEIKNNIFHNVNTDDILLSIKEGNTYEFTCYGWEYTNTWLDTYNYPCIAAVKLIPTSSVTP